GGAVGAGAAAGRPAHLGGRGVVEPPPGAVLAEGSVPGVGGAPGGEVGGQQPPLAAGADQVEDAVEDLAQVGRGPAGALAARQQRLDQGELLGGEGGVVGVVSDNPLSHARL